MNTLRASLFSMFLLLAACGGPSSPDSGQRIANPPAVMMTASPTWRAVPLVSAAQRLRGENGGEGCQWLRALVVSSDGRFLLYGTDVGGLWRSLDGGSKWEPCNVGYGARGTAGLAIDPVNPRRCLSVGANSAPSRQHGLWLSDDGAASWRQVLPLEICGSHDMRHQLAFDPASRDGDAGFTRRVYWSRIAVDKPMWGKVDQKPAVWRSDDGGATWQELPGTSAQAGGLLAVAPTGGTLYATSPKGLWASRDGGSTFTLVRPGSCTGLDICPLAPDSIWISTPEALLRSDDRGANWTVLAEAERIEGNGPLRNLRVSPADPARLAFWREGKDWNWRRFASHDGGRSFRSARVDGSTAFMPTNARQHFATWHPRDPRVCWSTGGDYPTISSDGGVTFTPASEGFNCVLVGGRFAFNLRDPDLLVIGSQDYNGAITRDGGHTWTYLPISGLDWGGFTYGGYALDQEVIFAGNAQSWGKPRVLRVSRDGGRTWIDTGLPYEGVDCGFGDPHEPEVGFAGSLRTADRGVTWQRMTGCQGVLACGPDGRLYGKAMAAVVRSNDHGVTWQIEATVKGGINDLAVGRDGLVWAVVGEKELCRWDGRTWTPIANLLPDQDPASQRITSVAVDPVDPKVVYVGRNRNVFMSSVAVQRSTDGGATWTNLTLDRPLDGRLRDGGREAETLRVHPRTRALWVAGGCYGLWTYPGPPP